MSFKGNGIMMVQMKVKGLVFDPHSNAYVVILRDSSDTDVLPIWIGKPEANSISFVLEGVLTANPVVHDLMKSAMDALGAKLISVVITDLEDNTYFAKLHIIHDDREITVDSRPSDAIALSLRENAPIFATESVLKKYSAEELDRWLENLSPEDFGDYEA